MLDVAPLQAAAMEGGGGALAVIGTVWDCPTAAEAAWSGAVTDFRKT